ncbi:hypothetical protein [Leucothrix pacifica]|uniref:Uncharacterized protein n=1 Tax=Leucothrix pacifica TaxID=1247513 RepID=A0A317CF27_9GAMM|nr:hypothetical protein [Leucothrix pacifica]PWQ97254.1 hypothetical protein DKW60_11025 [Leucothrix pacifica]
MAAIPNVEKLLIEAQKCFDLDSGQSTMKNRFTTLNMSTENHDEKVKEILKQLLGALELDEEDSEYFLKSIVNWQQFYKKLELNLWTGGAEKSHVVLLLLGYVFIPFIARTAAHWNIDGFKGKGMPNEFWYLPKLQIIDEQKTLLLPVQQVMQWFEDLLDQPMDQLIESLDANSIEPESKERSFYNWKKGTLPDAKTIERYFSSDKEYSFKGCYSHNTDDSLEDQFNNAFAFLKNKKCLDEEGIRDQLQLATRRLDRVFTKRASDEDKEMFIEATKDRFAVPDMSTIRKRFLLARASQDAFQKLSKILHHNVKYNKIPASKNKLLPLVTQYQRVFNLTTEAFNQCGVDQLQEDLWFENQLLSFEKWTTLLSILPSMQDQDIAEELSSYLTYFFESSERLSTIDHHFPNYMDREDLSRKSSFHFEQYTNYRKDIDSTSELIVALENTESPITIIKNYNDSHTLLKTLVHDFSPETTALILSRLEETLKDPKDLLFLNMHKLAMYLNKNQNRNKSTESKVDSLLKQAEESEYYHQWEAVFLQYRAKHHLYCNQFGNNKRPAEKYFKQAMAACERNNYGPLRGEIARDAFATLVAKREFNKDDQKYYRNLMRYMEISGNDVSLESSTQELRKYFWENLYKPYSTVERLRHEW